MINKFWNCKMSDMGARIKLRDGEWMMSTTTTDGSEFRIIGKDALFPVLSAVEDEISQTWTTLSELEEGIASSISDALLHLSNGNSAGFGAVSKMMLRRVSVLFEAIRLVVPQRMFLLSSFI